MSASADAAFFNCNSCSTLKYLPPAFSVFQHDAPSLLAILKTTMTTLNNLLPDYPMLYVLFLFLSKTTATTLNNLLSDYIMLHNGIMTVKRCAVRHVHLPSYFVFFAILIYLCCPCSLTPFIVILLFDVVLLDNLHICMMRHNFLLLSKFRFVQMLCR